MPNILLTEGVLAARLLIVDDHEIIRMGVRLLLAEHPQWLICGEASDGEQAVEKVIALAPDLVILDLTMPAMNGFEAAKEIRRVAPGTKIVFFSVHETPATARQVGADAFVAKSSAARDLAATVARVLQSGTAGTA